MRHLSTFSLFESHSEDQPSNGKKLLVSLGLSKIYVVLIKTERGPDYGFKNLIVFSAVDDEDAKKRFLNTFLESEGVTSEDLNDSHEENGLEEFVNSVLSDSYWTGAGWELSGEVLGAYNSSKDFKNTSLQIYNESWTNREYILQGVEDLKKAEEFLTDILGSSEAQRIMDKA